MVAIALSVLLLMTPATLHRIAYHGEDDYDFFQIGSILVSVAVLPLACGISADIVVVAEKISDNINFSFLAGALSFALLIAAWYVFPLLNRRSTAGCSAN